MDSLLGVHPAGPPLELGLLLLYELLDDLASLTQFLAQGSYAAHRFYSLFTVLENIFLPRASIKTVHPILLTRFIFEVLPGVFKVSQKPTSHFFRVWLYLLADQF